MRLLLLIATALIVLSACGDGASTDELTRPCPDDAYDFDEDGEPGPAITSIDIEPSEVEEGGTADFEAAISVCGLKGEVEDASVSVEPGDFSDGTAYGDSREVDAGAVHLGGIRPAWLSHLEPGEHRVDAVVSLSDGSDGSGFEIQSFVGGTEEPKGTIRITERAE